MKYIAFILAFLLFGIAARAGNPMQEVKYSTEKVLLLLNDPKVQGESKKDERRQLVRAEMQQRIEWDEICRNCLGRHWAELSPAGKAEFNKVFSEFLKEWYSDKIVTHYNDLDKVSYQGEQVRDNYWLSVKLVLTTKMKVDYAIEFMAKASFGDEWKIYDVVIDGVSIVKLYHDQLDSIITEFSYEELLKRIKSKLTAASIVL